MTIKELTEKPITEWSGKRAECAHGIVKTIDTEFALGIGAEEKLPEVIQKITPSGCGVLLLYEQGFSVEEQERSLRRSGYAVYPRRIPPNADYTLIEEIVVGDDVRVIAGFGGGFIADCAKYLAASSAKPSIVIVRAHSSTAFLLPSAVLGVGGLPKLFKTPPPKAVVCDPSLLPKDDGMNASAFGEIVSRTIALFDWKFSCIVRGETLNDELYAAALKEVDGVLSAFGRFSRWDDGVSGMLFESGLRLSALAAMSDSSRLYSGGDTACALVLAAMYEKEKRKRLYQGENEFLFSLILFETYRKIFCGEQKDFIAPPDNGMRAEKLSEILGIKESTAYSAVSPYISQNLLELYEYRVGEYQRELKEELTALKSRLSGAYRVFRRLHGDDGFSLRGYLKPFEAGLCIALAPEMRDKYGVLTYLKNLGLTDGYLLFGI